MWFYELKTVHETVFNHKNKRGGLQLLYTR